MKMSLQVNRTLLGKSFGLYFAQKLERDDDLRVDKQLIQKRVIITLFVWD